MSSAEVRPVVASGQVFNPALFQRVDHIIQNPSAQALIDAFFEPNSNFDGALVHQIRNNARDEITVEDLYAISLLNVNVGPHAYRELVGPFASQKKVVSDLLVPIPDDEDIWEGRTGLGKNSDASNLYEALKRILGKDAPVVAGKLMSRKRPRLIPIVDRVVVAEIGAPKGTYWEFFRSCLQDKDRQTAVESLRSFMVPSEVSILRLLDILIWMTGSDGEAAVRIRAGLPGFNRTTPCEDCGTGVTTATKRRTDITCGNCKKKRRQKRSEQRKSVS